MTPELLGYLAAFIMGAALAWVWCGRRAARTIDTDTVPRALFDATPATMWLKDCHNNIIKANKAAAASLGLTPPDLEGQPTVRFYPPDDAARYFEADSEVIQSRQAKTEIIEPLESLTDGRRWVRTDKVPYFDRHGSVVGVIVFSFDVTAMKESEQKLEDALEAAKRASRAKSDFLSVVSHEIRTPLGVILGFSELLMSHEMPEKTRLNYTEKIQRNGKRLQKLIDDLLDVSRIEQGQISIEPLPFALRPLVTDLESLFRPKAQAKNLELIVHVAATCPQTVISDPNRLRQIVSNVLENAIKFTTAGTVTVDVGIETRADTRTSLAITVSDTGAGVPVDAQSRLFQPFTQIDVSARMKGGVGLGLSLSRQLAQALGGDVTLRSSKPGEGSTFLICVDAGIPPEAARESEVSGSGHPLDDMASSKVFDGLTLLLVEDYIDIQDMIRRFLEGSGLTLLTAETGSDGVDQALKHHPDIMLMDLQLPKMDGMRATTLLRSQGYTGPIIAMTAHAMKGQQQACLDAGFDDFISKPMAREELLSRLRRFAKSGRE